MIYCVEDESSIRDLMLYTLSVAGFEVAGFENGAQFWAAMKEPYPQLILLDIMLPDEDGISILKKLRAVSATAQIPVIMATARGAEYDRVIGLDLGADDYLSKPFGMMEMVSRIKAVMRRAAPRESQPLLQYGGISIDKAKHLVTVDERPVTLTLKEYELLKLFMENVGHVFTREQLLSSVWGMDFIGETRTVDVHIGTLRTKLGTRGGMIGTVRGVGYRMEERHEQ